MDDEIFYKYINGDAVVLVHPDVIANLHLEGTDGDDALTGGRGDDVISGLAGNDILDGQAGADSLSGGSGDDVLVFDAADTSVDGGEGEDTLRVDGHGQVVDLMETDDGVFTGIEIIDLTGDGGNSLIVGSADILAINDDGTLVVDGTEEDTVNLQGTWSGPVTR